MDKKKLLELIEEDPVIKNSSQKAEDFLVNFLEGQFIDIMEKERYKYLLENKEDKGNGSYDRSINTILGKLNIKVPRTRLNGLGVNFLTSPHRYFKCLKVRWILKSCCQNGCPMVEELLYVCTREEE